MGTGKTRRKVNGVLIVDKPQGVTSHDIVAAVRAALHTRRWGTPARSTPMATGALVIGVGHATRLLQYIVEHTKTYSATIRFGQRTTTDAPTASSWSGKPRPPCCRRSNRCAKPWRTNTPATSSRFPNAVSAIKVNGQRAYDLAREGRHVELKRAG